jgi:hypothetical protein
MDAANPLSSWLFYAPYILLLFIFLAVLIQLIATRSRKESETEKVVVGLSIIGALTWALLNSARFLIYIIPQSGPLISNPFFAVPSIATAIFLYRIRGRHPLFYGTIEISVSVLAILVSIGASNNPLNKIVAVLGGIYIFIRGMDNVDKGLPTSWRPTWDWVFPKRATPQAALPLEQTKTPGVRS